MVCRFHFVMTESCERFTLFCIKITDDVLETKMFGPENLFIYMYYMDVV